MTLLCYDTGTHTAALNMAIDEVLFKKNEPVLRLYRWAGTAITLGRYQACMEVDVKRAETDGVPVIRRETGGKAVLHGDDLTISLILLKSKVTESVKKAVMKVGEGIVQGLRLLGIEAQQVVKGNKYHRSSYCFSLHSPYEVVVGIKKIAGIAGRRYMGKELYQVSIPFHVNPGDVRKYIILNNNEDQRLAGVIGLQEILPQHFRLNSIKTALVAGFAESLDLKVMFATLTEEEIDAAESVAMNKYNKKEWNLQR